MENIPLSPGLGWKSGAKGVMIVWLTAAAMGQIAEVSAQPFSDQITTKNETPHFTERSHPPPCI